MKNHACTLKPKEFNSPIHFFKHFSVVISILNQLNHSKTKNVAVKVFAKSNFRNFRLGIQEIGHEIIQSIDDFITNKLPTKVVSIRRKKC